MKKNHQAINISLKLLSLLLLFMLVQSCAKESNCGNQTTITNIYNIADSNKAKIPYKGNDTLIFISNQGDTATLIGSGKKAKYIINKQGVGSADCPKELIEKFENIDFGFLGKESSLYININFFTDEYSEELFIIKASSDSLSLSSGYNSLNYVNNLMNYKDSILLNDKYVLGVELRGVYYNFNYGILKIKFSNGKEYIKLQ
jgi:hypothetical protein